MPMRGDIIYQVYGIHEGRDKDCCFGAFRTRAEADAKIDILKANQMHGRNWAERYHNKGFMIRTTAVDTDFEIPPLPKPRDKYAIKTTAKSNRPGTWESTMVEVLRRSASSAQLEMVCAYERNYSMLGTFEPFRQGDREFP